MGCFEPRGRAAAALNALLQTCLDCLGIFAAHCRVNGKLGSQQAFFMGKLKISGSMGLAMKLQPILDAAAEPKAKL